MAGINKVFLVGNVGRDPEIRTTQNGATVANFSLATNETRTSREGERQERTEWHRIVAWRRQAEFVRDYIKRGNLLAVEGSIRTRQWEDRDGKKRYTTEIWADRVTGLGRREEGAREGGEPESDTGPSSGEPPYPDDDIPF